MQYHVYILQSEKTRRFYIGQTQNLEDRIKRHNSGREKSTKSGKPWLLLHATPLDTRAEAMKVERKLKNLKRVLEWIEKDKLRDAGPES